MRVVREYTVSGRVQGVGYRYFVVEVAERLGLDGQVRNLPDRRVEVLASGTAEQHAALLRALHEGPPLAHVKEVAVNPAADQPMQPGFRVKY